MTTKVGNATIRLPARYYRRYPAHQPLGTAYEDLVLPVAETVFLLIDVYGKVDAAPEELHQLPEFYRKGVIANREIILHHIVPAKAAAKKVGLPTVYLTNYLSPAITEHNEWRKMSLRTLGVDVLELWPEPNDILAFAKAIAPEAGEPVIKKQHYSGFFETHLESLFRELGTKNLIAVGFDSWLCLGTTIVDALFRNLRVIVLRDCTSTSEYPETAEGGWVNWLAIRHIEANIGYTATAEQFISACQAAQVSK